MRATRAYVAGFGTAGSVLAGAAVLFVVASAVVAFRGWPKIAGQQSPAALHLDASPVAGSRVARRLRAVVGAAAPAVAAPLIRTGGRPLAGARTARPSGNGSLQRPSPRATTPGAGGANGGRSGGGSTRPTSGGGGTVAAGGGGTVGAGGGGTGGGVTVSVPTKPPVTVTVPAGPPTTVTVPTPPVGKVVKKVTGSAGNAVSQSGAAAGAVVGGSAGSTVSTVTGSAGNTVSKVGGAVGNLLGG
jgi:hypothetical protein